MTKWNVLVTVDTTCSTEVVVEASTKGEAMDKALDVARDRPNSLNWELDEGNVNSSPYIADPDAASERIEP